MRAVAFWSLEPGAWSLEPGVSSPEPGARSPEPGAPSLEPGARSLEPTPIPPPPPLRGAGWEALLSTHTTEGRMVPSTS